MPDPLLFPNKACFQAQIYHCPTARGFAVQPKRAVTVLVEPLGFVGDVFDEGKSSERFPTRPYDIRRQCFAVDEIVACVKQLEMISYDSVDKGRHVWRFGDDVAPGVFQYKDPSQVEC